MKQKLIGLVAGLLLSGTIGEHGTTCAGDLKLLDSLIFE